MSESEYLLSYGLLGEFGRFRSSRPLALRRGDRAVVKSHRGLEVARVLRQATPRHAHFLPNTTVGQLLRLVTAADEATEAGMRKRAGGLLQRGNHLAHELDLPLQLLDAEVLLDGRHAGLHHQRWAECDVRPLESTLSREYDLHLWLTDLTRPASPAPPEPEGEAHGCGREGCGQAAGGCSSCGAGGCGTCGAARPRDVQAYFAGLREQMERRTPLL
jgi:hypothetical protein